MEKEKAFVKPEPGTEIAGSTVEGDGDPEEAGIHLRLSEESRRLAGIMTGVAVSRQMAAFIEVPGEIVFNRDKHARLIPRFPGIVREIMKNTGDNVKKGDVLARIQSNESLTEYSVISPLSGTVTARDISPGEYTEDNRSIFEIADMRTVWGVLHVLPVDGFRIRNGIEVSISSIDGRKVGMGLITGTVPVISRETRTIEVKAVIDNSDDSWSPGEFIVGKIADSSGRESVTVASSAIQYINDKPVVFIPEGREEFHLREVVTGGSDGGFTEILSGLRVGERYVISGAFELKAIMITSSMSGHEGHGH